MSGPAPKEIQGIPTRENTGNIKVVYLPTQETEWRKKIAQHARNIPEIESSFTEKEAAPPATQPFPESHEMEKIGADRIGAEPVIDIEDATDIMRKVAGRVVNSVNREEGLLTHGETVSGKKAVLSMRKRASLLEEKEGKAA